MMETADAPVQEDMPLLAEHDPRPALKLNVNVAEMKKGQPGVRIKVPSEEKPRLYDRVVLLDQDGRPVAQLITRGGAAWIEHFHEVIALREEGKMSNPNIVPFHTVNWASLKQDNHQADIRCDELCIYTNDNKMEVIGKITHPDYEIAWGHNHIHIVKKVRKATERLSPTGAVGG